ncbi:TIGR02922 family protein [Shewanella sp. UCD-KL21]|uniref:TIGR02922 family protein n=1 Tax=Shewanella sp. UCD-KL21 TaxID=1917164 RepID=UPI000971445E|nr:TIGR02922 family protein [Shewanella sp. UCD-KL21]
MTEVTQPLATVDKDNKATVTVLFYDAPAGLSMNNTVLKGLNVSAAGRVILPDEFREGKSIIAVLDGECTVLNTLGERVYSQQKLVGS